jgi:hypothetical protein
MHHQTVFMTVERQRARSHPRERVAAVGVHIAQRKQHTVDSRCTSGSGRRACGGARWAAATSGSGHRAGRLLSVSEMQSCAEIPL